jgi:hypothetical protein
MQRENWKILSYHPKVMVMMIYSDNFGGDIMSVPFIVDENSYQMGYTKWLKMDLSSVTHALICGKSGSGKSVFCKVFLSRIILFEQNIEPIIIIDPKGDNDFDFLDGLSRFYRGEQAINGLNYAYDIFAKRRNGTDKNRKLVVVFIDEVSSLMLMLYKKDREEAQKKLLLLLQLARSFRLFICFAMQQPAANMLGGSAAREQAGLCVCLGNAGAETLEMMFDRENREKIKNYGCLPRYCGWLTINGVEAVTARVGKVADFAKLHDTIRQNLMCEEIN